MALKDKLMTLEDFKAVRDVDVASNQAQFTEIKADLGDYDTILEKPITVEWAYTSGHYILTGTAVRTIDVTNPYREASFSGKTAFIPCSPGDTFTATLTGANTYKPYIFCDAEGNVLEQSETVITDYVFTAPLHAAYVGFNSTGANDYIKKGKYVFDRLQDNIDTVASDIADISQSIGSASQMVWEYTDKHYLKSVTVDPTNPYSVSNSYHGKACFLPCSPGDVFIVSVLGWVTYEGVIFYASDGTVVQKGTDTQYVNERIVAPEGAAYVGFNSITTDQYGTVQIGEYKVDEIEYKIRGLKPFNGMNGVAFGTSLTYRAQTTGGYLQYLPDLIGATIDNQGVGSAYWKASADTQYNILYNVTQYAGYADKDFCIIEGCINDWYNSNALGTYTDKTNESVCGCLYLMLEHIYAQNPNIQIIVILDHYGRLYNEINCSPEAVKGGKTQYEYYEEIAKLCEFRGIPVIKEYALSSIGEFGTQYLRDNIHCNALGAKQSAHVIAKALSNLTCKVVN